MNWDHIEIKWAAMTRRVRGDWPGCIKEAALQQPQLRRDNPRAPHAGLTPVGQAEARIIPETDTLQAE